MAYYFPCARIMLRSEFNESEGQYHWALPLAHCIWVHIEGRGAMEWFYLQVKNEISIPISSPISSGSTDSLRIASDISKEDSDKLRVSIF